MLATGLSSSSTSSAGMTALLCESKLQSMVQHTPRLMPCKASRDPAPFQLLPQPRGALQNLVPEALQLDLMADEVLLEVHAVGLNFRDVLNVLGMYPGDPGPPGADCAGVVIARGVAVYKLDIGMRPFAFNPPAALQTCTCLPSLILAPLLTHIPNSALDCAENTGQESC